MKSTADQLQEIDDQNIDLMLGLATLCAVLVRIFSLVWDSSNVGSLRFFVLTGMVFALVILYFRRKYVRFQVKFFLLVSILLGFFTTAMYFRALFSTMTSLLVTAPLIFSYLTSHRKAVLVNITMLVLFLSIGAILIYGTGLQVDPELFFLNPWNWFNDAIIIGGTTLAVLMISRRHNMKMESIHQSLATRQEQLRKQATELRWRKDELESQVRLRTSKLNLANTEIHDSNLLIAEKNLEIAWQNEEMERTVAEIRRIEQDLVESDKLASIGIFAQGISQHITGPLTTIREEEKNLRALIQTEPADVRAKLTELDDILISGIDRIDRIVKDLGKLSSPDPDELTDLRTTTTSAVQAILGVTAPHIRIIMEEQTMPVVVRGNSSRIERILINLLTNSCHALEHSAEGIIRVAFSSGNGWITATVEDNGDGIDAANLEKVQEPFFTTKDPGKGTGLGLFLCQSLMHDLGGKLEISSSPGEGTRVVLLFPEPEPQPSQRP